jgi:hypothetical protein
VFAKACATLCVMKSGKRKGDTVTFSVSVTASTKELLRATADRSYGGNVSELISEIAEQAARQDAAADVLRSHGRPLWTDAEAAAFETKIEAKLHKAKARRKAAA